MSIRSDFDEIDKLVKWYERFKPDAGREILVAMTPERLARVVGHLDAMGNPKPDRRIEFRGRTLVAVGKP